MCQLFEESPHRFIGKSDFILSLTGGNALLLRIRYRVVNLESPYLKLYLVFTKKTGYEK